MTKGAHSPVLFEEALEALAVVRDGIYVDGTFGRGGHGRGILSRLGSKGRLIGIDKDPEAIEEGRKLEAADPRFHIEQGSFAALDAIARKHGIAGQINGLLLDLGVSSPQLDDARRGFSFLQDGPLDMRMNPGFGQSAAEWLAQASEKQIAGVFQDYGEERFARRIAKAIVAARAEAPLMSTRRLAEIVAAANPKWERDKHPATRCFQAIRIFINQELDDLQTMFDQVLPVLSPGGRLVVISFHSLEDRIVKHFMREKEKGDDYPPGVPVTRDQMKPALKVVGKARRAGEAEVGRNPRARSAVLRVAEKLA